MKKLILILAMFLCSLPALAQRSSVKCNSSSSTEPCFVVYDVNGNPILTVTPIGVTVNQGTFTVNGPFLITSFPPTNPLSVAPAGTSEFGIDSNFQWAWSLNGGTVYDLPANPVGLLDCGTSTSCAATVVTKPMVIKGRVTLSGGTATVSGIPVGTFTSTTTFNCNANDETTRTNAALAVPASATSITVTGVSADVVSYQCSGN